ncbi:MAG TPA: hypothetical protein VHK24_04975 [Steroidobacter sp.]|jgi:hypothetical protein|nr:hypothetical protein [Steroidobacter sp.]
MQLTGNKQHDRRRTAHRRPSDYAQHVWTLVARCGMTPEAAAHCLATSTWRVERIVIGISGRNARRW